MKSLYKHRLSCSFGCVCVVLGHVPPTPQQLIALLKGVHNWWKGGELGQGVLYWLGVSVDKQQEIQEHCGSDEERAVEVCLQWWADHATDVSWRKIVHSLDWADETKVAITLRQYAESPSGEYTFSMSINNLKH